MNVTETARIERKPAPTPPQELPASENPVRLLQGKRVVIVEDEGLTQMLLRRAVVKAGLQVVGMAGNGKEGVEIGLRERPDIILMDIRMPIMDGLEAAALILAEYRVCIVMLTAFSTEEFRDKALQIGAAGYINKPVLSEMLYPELERAWAKFNAA